MNFRVDRVVFDFDNTLFDTETIKECFWEIGSLHGLTSDQNQTLYRAARENKGQITITMESFLAVMKKYLKEHGIEFQDRKVYKIIQKMDSGISLVPGAKKILELCQRKKIDRYLLSLGVSDWQEKKVKMSGIDKYFEKEKMIFTENGVDGKELALSAAFGGSFKGENTLLFNDKPDESERLMVKFPKLMVYLRREKRDKRYLKNDYLEICKKYPGRAFCSDDLNEGSEILINVL